mgnify:CR=1 FL=1
MISYYSGSSSGDLKVAHCSNLSCSSATVTPVDSTGNVGQYTGITIGATGYPLIRCYDVTNTDLKVANCLSITCTASSTITVDSTVSGEIEDSGKYSAVTVGADGMPVVVYYDATTGNQNLKFARAGNPFFIDYWTRR